MQRLTRIAGSFAVVAIAYWLYVMIVVPRIELPADPQQRSADEAANNGRVNPRELQLKQLAKLFPPSAWERLKKSTIINLDKDRNVLIFENHTILDNGQVRISPCTIIVGQEGSGKDDEDRRQSIILEAPEAVLKLDQPLDMDRLNVGRVEKGWLNGQIVIRSEGKDLRIVTSDVVLTEQVIETPNNVDFRFGANYGRGKHMTIKLLSDPPKPNEGRSVPKIVGIESFELQQIDKQQGVRFNLATSGSAGKPPTNTPVEIRCNGPFLFNAVDQAATFYDQVEVLKFNPSGPRDQVLCDVLAVHFVAPSKKGPGGAAAKQPPDLADLIAERIEARGNPVTITAPSESLKANGQLLEYNLLTKLMTMRMLDGEQDVMLKKDANEIRARSLVYQADPHDPNRRIGRITAQGPGSLRCLPSQALGHSSPAPSPSQRQANQQFEAVWNGQLLVYPSKEHVLVYPRPQEQVIELNGGATLTYRNLDGNGQWNEQRLSAQKIFFWLLEGPSRTNPEVSQLQPKNMQAVKDVSIVSSQVSGQVDELQVWFEESPAVEPGLPAVATANPAMPPRNAAPASASPLFQPLSPSQPLAVQQPLAAAGTRQHFEVAGRLLQARLAIGKSQPSVPGLTITGNVHFRETPTDETETHPLLIRGDRLRVINADRPSAEITIWGQPAGPNQPGQPATFEGRGLGLTGSNINLNCGTNRLWIDGAGRMVLPLERDLQGQPLGTPGVITIDWNRRMEFNGLVAKFEEMVKAAAQQPQFHARLQTETMNVTMQQAIRFSEAKADQHPEVEQIQCLGGVLVDNRTVDSPQQRQSMEWLRTSDLTVNISNGELVGGPGRLNRVWIASEESSANPLVASIGSQPGKAAGASCLKCLHVRFDESLSGNIRWHKLTLKDRVRATYATVRSWDAVLDTDDPSTLEPDGAVIHAEQIDVAEGQTPLGNARSAQLIAQGNVSVEGATFRTQSKRMSYDQAKDLLILEGDGYNDARLFQQEQPGAQTQALQAKKFQYNTKTKQSQIIGAASAESLQPASPNPQPRAPRGQVPGGNRRP